eukprot:11174462-Lingulodinium_polyedra.AAC.1
MEGGPDARPDAWLLAVFRIHLGAADEVFRRPGASQAAAAASARAITSARRLNNWPNWPPPRPP